MTQAAAASWPTLRSWTGATSHHPLGPLLDAADGVGDGGRAEDAKAECAVWDDLLRQIEHAQPSRWEGKRREFRVQRHFSETFSARCELVLAAWLTQAGVKVEFGFGKQGQPQPDLVLPEWGLGIEVGSRTLNGAQDLEDDIRAVVEHGGRQAEHVQITFNNQPLAIREDVQKKIVKMVRRGMEVDEEAVPARGDHPAVRVRITRKPSPGPTLMQTSVTNALLTPHFADVVAEIQSKVIKDSRKVEQAKSMPTVQVVDISRCGVAWLRPLPVWASVLQGMLDEHDPCVGIAVMVTSLADTGVQLAWAPNPHCDPALGERVSRLFTAT